MAEQNYESYQKNYSQNEFFDKILKFAKEIGAAIIYKALQLYYVSQKPDVPIKVKATIYGALGYLILPFDLVPDMIPVVGYGDDAAALVFALGVAHMYIDEDIRRKAKDKLVAIFGEGVLDRLEEQKVFSR